MNMKDVLKTINERYNAEMEQVRLLTSVNLVLFDNIDKQMLINIRKRHYDIAKKLKELEKYYENIYTI